MNVRLRFPKMSHRLQALEVPVTWNLFCIETSLESALKDWLPRISCPFPSPFCKLLWANRQCCWKPARETKDKCCGGAKMRNKKTRWNLIESQPPWQQFGIGLTFFLCSRCFETQSNKHHRLTLPAIHAPYLIGLVKTTCLNDRTSDNSAVYFISSANQERTGNQPQLCDSVRFSRARRGLQCSYCTLCVLIGPLDSSLRRWLAREKFCFFFS